MFGNYYGPQYNGYYYGQPQQPQNPQEQTIFNQLLTADEIAKLKKAPNFSSTKLTEDEYLRALCTHHSDNKICLEQLPSGKHRCSICGAEFNLITVDASPDIIERTCNDFYDLLQSIKTYYGNAPAALRDFYIMVGFIPKIRNLWNIAKQYFNRTVGGGYNYDQPGGDQSGFAMLGNILGNANMGGIAPVLGGNYMGYPQAGYYGGAPVPQAAYMQTPQAPPPMYPQQQYVQPQPMQQQQQQAGYQVMPQQQPTQYQQPMYGYGGYPQQQYAPPPAPPVNNNPIGYVDAGQKDFTQNTTPAGQPVSQTQQPPLPNPNLTNPNLKADVGKKFT